ncbi:MAG: hypothetical protein RLZZ361_885 [Cyanobacteriota bacterium]|jgi:predicted AAA+ superfamily ATPase
MQIKREIFAKLAEELENKKVLILLGPRQVGKSYLMVELENYVLDNDKQTQFFNLELPEDSRFFSKDKVELYKSLVKNTDYLFIDEFQYYENASQLFKAIFDDRKTKLKIIASGSSALEMHKHLKESLAGRKNSYIITPLNFQEIQQSKTSFSKYLSHGGYPELVSIDDQSKQEIYLKEILSSYILRDIKALIKEENISEFNNLLYQLAFNQGQIISTNSLANELRMNNRTIEKYLEILSQTYILHRINSYSQNLSNELKKSKKYYFYDMGIRNAILNNFKPGTTRKDKGSLYEQYVCNFLINNCPANSELRFWRTRNDQEIDFVLLKNHDPYLFEVKSKLNRPEIPESIKTFIRNYRNVKQAFVINENLECEAEYDGISVDFIKIENLEYDCILKDILNLF